MLAEHQRTPQTKVSQYWNHTKDSAYNPSTPPITSALTWRREFDSDFCAPPPTDINDAVTQAAINNLSQTHPEESAKRMLSPQQTKVFCTLLLITGVIASQWPLSTVIFFNAAATIYYLCAILFRVWLLALGATADVHAPAPAKTPNRSLPGITILLPLHRDAKALPMLANAIDALDYPDYKKDVKLLLEECDRDTIAEAYRLRLDNKFHLIIVPKLAPQTKPKACNVGLELARGELIVIYDAEDSPEPDQLRKAAAAFSKCDDNLACVQARLNYYNRNDNWLTRLFTLEYSLWFDWLLPALQRMEAPIPLGGTSNFFKGFLAQMHPLSDVYGLPAFGISPPWTRDTKTRFQGSCVSGARCFQRSRTAGTGWPCSPTIWRA